MTKYYGDEDFDELNDFTSNIDIRAEQIVKGYVEAKKERENADDLKYEVGISLLTFGAEVSEKEIEDIVADQYGKCRSIYKCSDGSYMVEVENSLGLTVDKAVEAYSEYTKTVDVARNDYAELTGVSVNNLVNDPYITMLWHLDRMETGDAWQFLRERNHSKIRVAILDSGVDPNNNDLQLSDLSADVSGDTPVLYKDGGRTHTLDHGLMVAGSCAALSNNGLQVAGVGSGINNDVIELISLQTLNPATNTAPVANMVKAVDYSLQCNVKVINYSVARGGGVNDVEKAAIDRFNAAGGTFVCSAGNYSNNGVYYPSDYDNVISVMSTDENNNLADFSNFGWAKDICAPGTNIITTGANNVTVSTAGTSFSSPIVAGVVAMMYSVNPNINFDQVKAVLCGTATDLGDSGKDERYGYGLVNAYKAVVGAVDSSTIITTQAPGVTNPSGDGPQEVFGQLVSSARDNHINVVWGSNVAMEQIGQVYNVYIDDVKRLENVTCGSYDFNDIAAGKHKVKITAVYNGKETSGVVEEVQVGGSTDTGNNTAVEINGWQISTTSEGYRVIYSIGNANNNVTNFGLVYGLGTDISESDMVVGSSKRNVYSYDATNGGKLDEVHTSMGNAQSYVMTMKSIKSPEFYRSRINVRAYARLNNGSYVYSNVESFTIYDVADHLYQNLLMKDMQRHNYLYDNILHFTNSSYGVKNY